MKIVRVQYTVKPEFVETNTKNIRAVMADLRSKPIAGLRYVTFQLPDGNSFMHVNLSDSEEASAEFGKRESFKAFRMALKASEPISPPNAEDMSLVGSSFDML